MAPRLILIDGLPGSGKSTLAVELGRRLPGARVYLENEGPNPFHAFEPGEEVAAFSESNHYTPAQVAEKSLEAWQTFANRAEPCLHIAESYPFQSGVRVILQMDGSLELIHDYFHKLEHLARPISPMLIELSSGDVLNEIERIALIRGAKWAASVVAFIEETPWARNRSLTGMEAARAFMKAYAEVVECLLKVSTLPRIQLPGGKGFSERVVEQAYLWIQEQTCSNV